MGEESETRSGSEFAGTDVDAEEDAGTDGSATASTDGDESEDGETVDADTGDADDSGHEPAVGDDSGSADDGTPERAAAAVEDEAPESGGTPGGDTDAVEDEAPESDADTVSDADALADDPAPTGEDAPGVADVAAAETETDGTAPFPEVASDAEAAEADSAAVEDAPATEVEPGPSETMEFDDEFDSGVLDGPEEDQEMPLADHIEEMVRRLAVVFFVAGIATLVTFPIADQLINYLWNAHIPGAADIASRRPRLYGPLELILTELKVASLAGVVLGLPVLVYQSYRFMKPGLFPRERRYYLAAVPTSLVLALVGVAFAHLVVLPVIFAYFTAYTEGTAVIAFGLRETFNLILILMGYMAVVFQIPLFVMLAIMMGLVTRQWLTEKRLLFWGSFLGLAFLVSPDPTGMAPIIVAATMITLFEGTLTLLKWTGN